MSKTHDGTGKIEKKTDTHEHNAHPGQPGNTGQPAHPKKVEHTPTQGKGHNPMPGGCFSWGCKVHATKFNFCPEHYDHFKFGLIKKTGEPVSDYEKKFEHFLAHKKKRGATQAA